MMIQLIPFDQAKAGTQKNFCLQNVRLGFGLRPKDSTAWESWLNSGQHTDDIPAGLDVPVYFSYWATIDGQYQNWGHIGVRLADGRFWSDGYFYQNIGEYTATHAPVYVGWGTMLEGIEVITKETTMTDEAKKNVYRSTLHREPENDEVWRGVSDDPQTALSDVMKSEEWLTQNHVLLRAYPDAQAQITDLSDQLTKAQAALMAEQNKPAIIKEISVSTVDTATATAVQETNKNVNSLVTWFKKIFNIGG